MIIMNTDPSTILDKSQDSLFSEENKNKNICVIWSGGCDSTLLLDNILWELDDKKDYRTVVTYSFKHWQLSDEKMAQEETARLSYRQYALSKNYRLGVSHVVELPKQTIIAVGCPQPSMWLTNILPHIDTNTLLYAGYIKGDDFFTYDVFKHWCLILEGMSYLYGKNVTPMFPLKYKSKKEIIKTLKIRDLLKYTWHCETPTRHGTECGYCEPCEKHNVCLKSIELEEEKIKEEVQIKLDDLNIKKVQEHDGFIHTQAVS